MKINKEANKYSSLIIILSVLLVISLIAGSTFAWFASEQSSTKSIKLGDAVVVNIIENHKGDLLKDNAEIPFTIPRPYVLPGMKIDAFAAVKFQTSKTPAILRVRLEAKVESQDLEPSERVQESLLEFQNALNERIGVAITSYIDVAYDWVLYKGWWYYTGGQNSTTIKDSVLKEIDCTTSPIITLLDPKQPKDQHIIIPSHIGNDCATSKITFTFEVQAVQAKIPKENDELGYVENSISNVQKVFDEAFYIGE